MSFLHVSEMYYIKLAFPLQASFIDSASSDSQCSLLVMKTLFLLGLFSTLWQIVDTPGLRGSYELAQENIQGDGFKGEYF